MGWRPLDEIVRSRLAEYRKQLSEWTASGNEKRFHDGLRLATLIEELEAILEESGS